jgi:hypothetical protein
VRATGISEGFRETLSEERQRGPEKTRWRKTTPGEKNCIRKGQGKRRREELHKERPGEENSSREDTMDSEGVVG